MKKNRQETPWLHFIQLCHPCSIFLNDIQTNQRPKFKSSCVSDVSRQAVPLAGTSAEPIDRPSGHEHWWNMKIVGSFIATCGQFVIRSSCFVFGGGIWCRLIDKFLLLIESQSLGKTLVILTCTRMLDFFNLIMVTAVQGLQK